VVPYRSLNLGVLRNEISARLRSHAGLYDKVRIRAVAVKAGTMWSLAWCSVQMYPRGLEAPPPESSVEYQNAVLAEMWIEPDNLNDFLNGLAGGTVGFDGFPVEVRMVTEGDVHLHEARATDPHRFGRPVHFFTIAGAMKPKPGFEALVDPAHAYYPDVFEAIRLWLRPHRFDGPAQDGRFGSVIIELPECRAYFDKLVHADGKLRIEVAAVDDIRPVLRVRGLAYRRGEQADRPSQGQHIAIDSVSNTLEVPLPHDTYRLELVLLTTEREEVDWHLERPLLEPPPRGRVLNPTPGPSLEEDEELVMRALMLGEGVHVEFKPWTDPGHEKFAEIVETVIAFANTQGGVLLFGVDDHCAPNSTVDEVLLKAIHKKGMTEKAANDWAVGAIRQGIAGSMNRVPALRTAMVTIDNRTVILLNVAEGADKPYARLRNNDVYVRRGANNVRPHPDHDWYALLPKQPGADRSPT